MSGKIVVSACLLGTNCKYNGGSNRSEAVLAFLEGEEIIPVCPEVLAGLGIPRTPIEIREGVVVSRDGKCVDKAIRDAVAQILGDLEGETIACAILKSRSPTCGVRQVYDGTFSGKLVDGAGVLARTLQDRGYRVLDSEEIISP